MNFESLFGKEWYDALNPALINSNYWISLGNRIAHERKERLIYPEKNSNLFFKAFRTTPISKVKVVILGQDPYHDGSYDGFAFSNSLEKRGRISPSLMNILTEVNRDIYSDQSLTRWFQPEMVNLERWAQQGVLLINTAHTVVKSVPDSHVWLWKPFTTEIIQILLRNKENIVWILWGRRAQKTFWDILHELKEVNQTYLMDNLIIQSAHPSPFSAYQGFFGSKPFSKTNAYLEEKEITHIIW